MPASIDEIAAYLDTYLRVRDVPDDPRALNGLQVGHDGVVSRIGAAVDACQASIDWAADAGADLLLVHHGLFWGGLEPLTGRHLRRVRTLLDGRIALYAAHAPLDLHPQVGNNAVLAGRLGIDRTAPFGEYEGVAIGVIGDLSIDIGELARRIEDCLGREPRVLPFGPGRTRRVALVSGAASSLIHDARAAGADTFITGEGPHHTFFDAEEWRMNVVYAGHYATETVGVQALASHVAERFDVPWEFFDHPTGM